MCGFDRQPSGAPQEATLKMQTFNKMKVCAWVFHYPRQEKKKKKRCPQSYMKFNTETGSVTFQSFAFTENPRYWNASRQLGVGGGGGAKPGSHVLLGFWLWHSSDIIETQKHSVPSLCRSYKAVQCREAAPSSLPPARKWKTPDTWELLVHDLNAIRGCSYTFPITAAECATHE